MPEYEFICEHCETEFAIDIPMSDREKRQTCPKCLCKNTKRVYGPTQDVWKTDGSYKNSSRGKK